MCFHQTSDTLIYIVWYWSLGMTQKFEFWATGCQDIWMGIWDIIVTFGIPQLNRTRNTLIYNISLLLYARDSEVTYLLCVFHLLCSFVILQVRLLSSRAVAKLVGQLKMLHEQRAFWSFTYVDHVYCVCIGLVFVFVFTLGFLLDTGFK